MQAFRPGKMLLGGPTEDILLSKSEPAADCFEQLHLHVQLQVQPFKIVCSRLTLDGCPCLGATQARLLDLCGLRCNAKQCKT